jgi:hypothetical protein
LDLFNVWYKRYLNLVDCIDRKIDFLKVNNDNKIQGDLPEIKQFIEELEHFTR